MDLENTFENLRLSVPEVGDGEPTHRGHPSSPESGSLSGSGDGSADGTWSESSHSTSRERRRSTNTAVTEEDNFQGLHSSCSGLIDLSRPLWDYRFHTQFDDINEVSQGSFGQVMRGRKKCEDKYYAVKIVPKWEDDDEDRRLREVKALAHFEHKNIVRYYTYWWEEYKAVILDGSDESDSSSGRLEPCLFIQMELCDLSLYNWIWKRNKENTEDVDRDQILRIFLQIIDGVNYIHSKNYIHRDLKPKNILLLADMTVKIGDLGLVTPVGGGDKNQHLKRTRGIGDPMYMAPEMKKEGNYDRKVDIFPLGLILFELFIMYCTESEKAKTWDKIRAGELPTKFETAYPPEACEIKRMLSRDPKMRPSTEDLTEVFSY